MQKIKCAIIGPGNIGQDLMIKISRSGNLELAVMAGRKESAGIAHARKRGVQTAIGDISPILEQSDIKIVFDCTSAAAHLAYAPLLKQAGKIAIDLTPAAVGPYVVPCVNLEEHINRDNVNMVTCGGQATAPIMFAINRAADVEYGEIVSAISSKSAGPGTRANIDEFTETTARALRVIGGADRGKAIIILNPAEPPCLMTNTIYAKVRKPDLKAITESVNDIVKQLKGYVPGYTLRVPPMLDGDKVTVIIQVEGNGDFLPKYSGNLDIINAAAIAVAEKLAARVKEA